MPDKYVMQMICDWEAMGKKFGDNAKDYFNRQKVNMVLHPKTIEKIEKILN
jgi:hypothetical protein